MIQDSHSGVIDSFDAETQPEPEEALAVELFGNL